jgi:hypothetical protein
MAFVPRQPAGLGEKRAVRRTGGCEATDARAITAKMFDLRFSAAVCYTLGGRKKPESTLGMVFAPQRPL